MATNDRAPSPALSSSAVPRSTVALGQLLVVAVALALIAVGIVTANGTVWPPLAAGAGIGLLARLAWVMSKRGEFR